MIEQRARLTSFIRTHAGPELRQLHKLGGEGLVNLAMDIYVGFGLNPGQDQAIIKFKHFSYGSKGSYAVISLSHSILGMATNFEGT